TGPMTKLPTVIRDHAMSQRCVAEFASMGSTMRCRIRLYGIKSAACGGADVRPSRVPAGPIPLAARGLAAVLARAGAAGTVRKWTPAEQTRLPAGTGLGFM